MKDWQFEVGTRLWLVALAMGVAVLILGGLLVVSQGQPYTALVQVCGAEVFLAGPHVRTFGDVGAAQAWADEQLAGTYDLAFVSRGGEVWVRSESVGCYGGMFGEWTRVE